MKRFLNTLMARHHARYGVLAVEIKSPVGLGAKLEWCLEIMAYCNEHDLLPYFKFAYPDSDGSEDHFSTLFTTKSSLHRPVKFIQITSITELDLGQDYDCVLNIRLASELIAKYLVIREDIIQEVEKFCCEHFAHGPVLGVHYRATDKAEESPVVPYERVKNNIEYYLELYPKTQNVFVATDDDNCIEELSHSSLSRPLLFREDSFRSRDGNAVHRSAWTDKSEVNRDAIVNCLLLSRCDALLKTASILSGWSKLFNPQLPTVMLSVPYDEYLWFPERELVRRNLFEPIQ